MTPAPTDLYRASGFPAPERLQPAVTSRPPSWVPYVIDNLWEWTRPDEFPSRRTACFASPTPTAALKTQDAAQTSYVHRVLGLPHDWRVAQYALEDARFDPDIRGLQMHLKNALGRVWFGKALQEKEPESLIFCPVLSKDEVGQIVTGSVPLRDANLAARVSFWSRVRMLRYGTDTLCREGEVFFSIPPEGVTFERIWGDDGQTG